MRIVQTDNYGMSGETPGKDEKFILWPMSEDICLTIAVALNDDSGDGLYYYVVKADDYVLQVFEP